MSYSFIVASAPKQSPICKVYNGKGDRVTTQSQGIAQINEFRLKLESYKEITILKAEILKLIEEIEKNRREGTKIFRGINGQFTNTFKNTIANSPNSNGLNNVNLRQLIRTADRFLWNFQLELYKAGTLDQPSFPEYNDNQKLGTTFPSCK